MNLPVGLSRSRPRRARSEEQRWNVKGSSTMMASFDLAEEVAAP
jgi:hypothetical protein